MHWHLSRIGARVRHRECANEHDDVDRLAAISTLVDFCKTDWRLPDDIDPNELGGDDTEDVEWDGRPQLVWDYLSERLQNLRLFVTRSGYLGLAYAPVQEGDLVFLLEGGNMPFLLRLIEGRYRIVSICYVHGIMDGDTWLDGQSKLVDIQIF